MFRSSQIICLQSKMKVLGETFETLIKEIPLEHVFTAEGIKTNDFKYYFTEHLGFLWPLLSLHGFVCSSGVYFPKRLSGMIEFECSHIWAHRSTGGPQLQNVNCHQDNLSICKLFPLHQTERYLTLPFGLIMHFCLIGHYRSTNNEIYAKLLFHPPNVLQRPQGLIQLRRWVVLRSQVRFQLKEVMLRVSHCLDRLFELIRSGRGGSQLVSFQVFNCTHVPPYQIGFSIRSVSDSVQCPLWSGGTFSVPSSQSRLSVAMKDYCFNQPDIVNYPFHWSEEAGKDKSNFATLAFDLGRNPQASGLELHDLWKVTWLSTDLWLTVFKGNSVKNVKSKEKIGHQG